MLVGKGGLRRAEVPVGFEPFEEKGIVGWERFDDYPDPTEHERLGLEYEYTFETGRTRTQVVWAERGIVAEGGWWITRGRTWRGRSRGRRIGTSWAGGRSGCRGWSTPSCPRCGREMGLVFQAHLQDHVQYMFGERRGVRADDGSARTSGGAGVWVGVLLRTGARRINVTGGAGWGVGCSRFRA